MPVQEKAWLSAAAAAELACRYGREPWACAGASGLAGLLDWPDIERLMSAPGADALAAREGRLSGGPAPRAPAQVRAAFAGGWTLVVRRAGRHHDALAGLERRAESLLGGSCRAQVYVTPAGGSGFGWHYDAEEVLILQTAGVKEYRFRRNTVNPRPRVDAMPRDMRYELESSPMMGCVLSAGDALHLPSGWWHRARATENSVSVSLGLLPEAGLWPQRTAAAD